MKTVWLLLAVVAALLLFNFREGFVARPSSNEGQLMFTLAVLAGLDPMDPASKNNPKVVSYLTQLQAFYDSQYSLTKNNTTLEQAHSFINSVTDPTIDKNELNRLISTTFRTPLARLKEPSQSSTPAPPAKLTPEQLVPPSTPEKAQTITPAPYVTGTSTGGTSTSSMGPNSGGATTDMRSQKVWGPEFQGLGMEMGGADQGDTTSSRSYPFLIGPKGPESTRIDGLGIVPPSKNYQLANDGSLPSAESTGSAPGSQYLPNSRTPGDQDLIPDPYRVATAFSTSTYSSKTEPVPFLTDFSAFQK